MSELLKKVMNMPSESSFRVTGKLEEKSETEEAAIKYYTGILNRDHIDIAKGKERDVKYLSKAAAEIEMGLNSDVRKRFFLEALGNTKSDKENLWKKFNGNRENVLDKLRIESQGEAKRKSANAEADSEANEALDTYNKGVESLEKELGNAEKAQKDAQSKVETPAETSETISETETSETTEPEHKEETSETSETSDDASATDGVEKEGEGKKKEGTKPKNDDDETVDLNSMHNDTPGKETKEATSARYKKLLSMMEKNPNPNGGFFVSQKDLFVSILDNAMGVKD